MKFRILLLYTALCLSSYSQSSTKEYSIHTVVFYNLENLYDTINDPETKDEYSPILKVKTGRSKVYWEKINNMAKVISDIGKDITKGSPTIIGLAEVENKMVLKDLVQSGYLKGKGYDFSHIDSPDWRGSDVALLYKKAVFNPVEIKPYTLFAFNEEGFRIKSRDQLLVTGFLENEKIHILLNHWPSQLGGKKKTAYLREKSAELSLEIISEIYQQDSKAKIILMGDFNDNPTDKSIQGLMEGSSQKLFNPFISLFNKGYGTLGFRDQLQLFDQIIINSKWKKDSYTSFQYYKAGIYNPSYLIANKGRFKGYPYRSWSQNNEFTGGYSDHFPVYVFVVKEAK